MSQTSKHFVKKSFFFFHNSLWYIKKVVKRHKGLHKTFFKYHKERWMEKQINNFLWTKIWTVQLTLYTELLQKYLFKMFDWYHRYTLSKYCEIGISQKKNKAEIFKRNPFKTKEFMHMFSSKFFEAYASLYATVKKFVEPWFFKMTFKDIGKILSKFLWRSTVFSYSTKNEFLHMYTLKNFAKMVSYSCLFFQNLGRIVFFKEHISVAALEINIFPSGIWLLKFNQRNTRKGCEIQ